MRILFRFVLSNKTVWIGYTEGKTWEEIYNGIDEFGDAYEHLYPTFRMKRTAEK